MRTILVWLGLGCLIGFLAICVTEYWIYVIRTAVQQATGGSL